MSTLEEASTPALEHVLEILNAPIIDKNIGICGTYIEMVELIPTYIVKLFMLECCKELNIYSGCNVFPIGINSNEARLAYFSINNVWDKRTTHGKQRWSVLNLMRSKLQQELSNRGESK